MPAPLSTLRLLAGRGLPLGSLPAVLARRFGDRTAVDTDTEAPGFGPRPAWSFRELEEAVGRLARGHAEAGLEGRTVLLAVDDRVDALLQLFALARAGAVVVPVSPRLRPEELAEVARAAGGDALVADAELLRRAASFLPTGAPLRSTDAPLPSAGLAPRPQDTDAVCVQLCTSGTTGTPKAAALTSRGLLGAPGRLVLPLGRRSDGSARWSVLAALPLAHVMGIATALGALCAGALWIHRRRFEPERALDLLESGRATAFVGVPTMYADLEAAGAERRDLSSVLLWVSGADAMPPERARRFQRMGAVATLGRRRLGTAAFVDVYGMVELSGPAALRVYPPGATAQRALPVPAVALPGFRVRAVDEEGRPVGLGRRGELQFRGPSVLRGYRGRTDGGPGADGWFASGDFGRVFPLGTFAFAGRSRDRLKVSGFSVFPAEVEAVLARHPEVAEVALVGLPDPRLGERPAALVVPRSPTFPHDEFLAWAEERVAGYRRPRAVATVRALPRGHNGKIDRPAAAKLAEEADFRPA